jgi:diadenosine tetraphosphatase ApaH/serine/threonine PP2A family protein phosphatase
VRYGVIGDIHSNLPALRAVLEALGRERTEGLLCVGDLVGYGAQAAECLEIVRGLAPILVAGNHDWAVAGRLSLEFFNGPARAAIQWTQRMLPKESRDWLGSLPVALVEGDITLAHSTIASPEAFDYLQTTYDAYLSFQALTTRTAFVGHSHVPITFFDAAESRPIVYVVGERIEMGTSRTISNVGSVGQPRDDDPRASFGVFDSETRVLEIHRVEYDVDAAAASIRAAGLPPLLAERLRLGR